MLLPRAHAVVVSLSRLSVLLFESNEGRACCPYERRADGHGGFLVVFLSAFSVWCLRAVFVTRPVWPPVTGRLWLAAYGWPPLAGRL